jgi:hypothetical protein
MWELRRLTTLWAFTTCYRDSFTFLSSTATNMKESISGISFNRHYNFLVRYLIFLIYLLFMLVFSRVVSKHDHVIQWH